MIISLDLERTVDKNQCPFVIRILSKVEIEGDSLSQPDKLQP